MLPKTAAPQIVVLKGDRLYGDLICRQIKELWRNATVQVFQRGLDALDAIQASMPDIFITGVKIEDMDGLEHLEPFIERDLPILIVTSRKDARTFSLLRNIRYDGIYDGYEEGLANLRTALEGVMDGSDDQQAAERLGLSPYTVNTHRKAIMGKLGLHHKGQLMLYALQQGYVQVTPDGIYYPGFQRRIRESTAESKAVEAKACA